MNPVTLLSGGREELKEKLRDAYWRRFTSVLRGIADFGIRKPGCVVAARLGGD